MASPSGLANYQDMFFSKEANDVIAEYLKRKIRSIVNDPAIAEKLTPKTYPYGTKRQPLDTNYFETFNKKNVALVDASTDGPIEEITPNGIRAGGKEYPLDIIVIATGFDAMTGPLKNLGIKGRGGRALVQEWEDGPQTYLGLAIAGYPNLFTITGPQSPSVLSNMPVSIEQHVEWITECIAHMRRNKLKTIEASPQAQDTWGAHVAEVVNSTLMPGTNSWYMGANIEGKPRRILALPRPRRRRRLPQEVRRGRREGLRGLRVRERRARRDRAHNCGRINSASLDRGPRSMWWQLPACDTEDFTIQRYGKLDERPLCAKRSLAQKRTQ